MPLTMTLPALSVLAFGSDAGNVSERFGAAVSSGLPGAGGLMAMIVDIGRTSVVFFTITAFELKVQVPKAVLLPCFALKATRLDLNSAGALYTLMLLPTSAWKRGSAVSNLVQLPASVASGSLFTCAFLTAVSD